MKKKLLFITFLMLFCSTMFGQDHYVPVNTGQYSTSTTFISVISFDGVEQAKELELGVFCNDEVRASVRTSYNPIKKRYIAIASVKGQSGDVFKFKVYDHSTNTEWSNDCTITYVDKNGITRVAQYVTFDSENGYGTPAQPCIINFNTPLHWTYNDSFENGMIVNSIVKIDNITQQNTNYELGVFCVDDVRGSAKLNSDGTVNTMVYGNAGDVFTFNLYDPNKGEGFDNNGELIFTEVNNITFNENGYFNLEVNFITAPYVAQIGTENYTSFEAALEAAVDGDEITLLEDVTLAVNPTVVSKDININVDGKTVTGTIELAHTGATVTCAEGAVTVTTNVADYNLVYDGVMYKLVAKVYVAQVGDVKYESIQEAVDAAQAGNEIVVIAAIDGEAVVVDKNVTISGSVTLNDVSINAVEGASELTVSGLSFTGNSWINSGAASKLTVTGVSANVTPSNATYTNSRSAFISLGRSEGKQLELIVTDCNIVANGGGDAILGWAAITNATLTGNTFGSETAYQTNSDCVKFMAIADGAVFNITGNTIYSNYNGIVFGQNTTRDNAYTVNVNTNNFYGSADHIWIEVSGSNTTHATIKATSDNKVNGNEFTAKDIKLHPNLNTFTSYAGVDVVLDVNGKVLGGTFKYVADGVIADGYEKAENNDGTYGIIKSISGKISYRAYVNDTETREGLGVDLENIVAKESVVVKLYDANDNPLTTTSLKAGGAEAAILTCNIVLWGDPSSSWETTIHATELTVANVPYKIELIIDEQELDTFTNALGEGTNVDETEDYKALDCVYKEAKIGETLYATFAAAYEEAATGNEIILLANVDFAETTVSKDININLNNNTVTGTIVLANTGATVTCAEGAVTVTTNVAGYKVVFEDGMYKLVAKNYVAQVGEVKYESFEAALNAVQNGETITLLGTTGSEDKELEFTKDIEFTITGTAPNYALPVVTFQNATVNIEDATILIPELDARQNATINVIDSKVYDAGGNSIAKSYYNGAINISGTSEVYMMQVTTMGYINISGTAKLHATWQTNVYGNGLITLNNGATFNTAALHLTGQDYNGRDNTDAERVGKPAEIIVDGADFTIGKVYSSNGADYSYNSSHGINIGTIDGKFAILNVKNGGKVNYHMADGETANIGAGGTVNVNASTFKTQCRAENGTVTLANNGTFNVTGAAILAANVTGDGWFYMNSVAMTEATNLNGAKVRFASGTNNIVGSTIDNGFFQVGIGAYNGQDEKVDTVNGVVVNVTNNAKIGAKDEPYAGWLGTGFYDTDAEKLAAMTNAKYVLNIVNSIAEFGYIHVSNDGELNVSGNATVKAWYNNSDYSFYAGDLIINGTAEFDATDVLAIYTKVSCDNGTDNPGTLNINAGTEYEAERHNGAIDGTNFDIRKTGVVNVAANTNLHIGEYTSIAADAKMNIAGEATALGTITNNGAITLTTEAAKLTTPELTTNVPTTNVPEYKVVYENGTYKVVAKVYVAEVNGVKYESLQEAVNVGGEVTILQDFVLTETVTIASDKEVVLDLNGKTINVANDQINCDIYGKLTVNDTEGTGVFTSRNHFVQAGAELIVNAGTIQNIATATGGFPINLNGGTVTVNGGTVQAVNNDNYAIGGNGGGTLVINDGTIKGNWGAVNMSIGTATINGGTLEVTGAIGGHALYVAGSATATVSGGEFKPYQGSGVASYAVVVNGANATVNISGGMFHKEWGCVLTLDDGTLSLTGGTYEADVNEYCHANYAAIQGADNLWRVEQVIFVMETALANGWNWFSAYVDIDGADGLASIKESLGTKGLMVKDGETGNYIQYTASAGTWNGTLTETSSVGMYMIKTSADIDEFIVKGSAKLDPSDEEMMMAISKGWNYIPYPLDVAQSITTALGFTPQHGDIIKGKGSTAVYVVGTNGYGWLDEFNMEPGQGYMYKSNATATMTFNYSYPTGGAKSSMLANVETIDYHWTVDAHKYANSMNMIAMVNVDGEMVKGGYEVAAFSNEGECRGTARPFYVEDMDAYLMILTIHGEEVENLTFRYYDIDTDTEYELNNVVTYSDNAIVGTIDNPYIFTMNILGIGENSIDNINIYPNPTTTDREINLQATCDKVEVFNALGVKVAEYHNVDTLDALETAGIYVIRITNDNAVKHCRLVVK